MGGIGPGIATWIVVAVLSVLALFVLAQAIRSILRAARLPAPTVSALRLHDQAAGSLGKGSGIAAVLIYGLVFGDGDLAGSSLWIGGLSLCWC